MTPLPTPDSGPIPVLPPVELPVEQLMEGPVVWPDRPVVPCPDTPQYGEPRLAGLMWGLNHPAQPSRATRFGGWCHANLRSYFDLAEMTARQKLTRAFDLYYAETQGWILNFWRKDFMDEIDDPPEYRTPPAGWLDLRHLYAAYAQYQRLAGKFPYEVVLGYPTGHFTFSVELAEQAEVWSKVFNNIIYDGVMIDQEQKAREKPLEIVSAPDPARMRQLRALWLDCVHAASLGTSSHCSVYAELYSLYDSDGGNDLSYEELEACVRDLILVRKNEVQKILVQEERAKYANTRSVLEAGNQNQLKLRRSVEIGKRLSEHYEGLLERDAFLRHLVELRLALDRSKDGWVSIDEFMFYAPDLLMNPRLLAVEAEYLGLSRGIARAARDDEGGCVQQ